MQGRLTEVASRERLELELIGSKYHQGFQAVRRFRPQMVAVAEEVPKSLATEVAEEVEYHFVQAQLVRLALAST